MHGTVLNFYLPSGGLETQPTIDCYDMNFSYAKVSMFHESGRSLKTQTVNILLFCFVLFFFLRTGIEFVHKIELAESNCVSSA